MIAKKSPLILERFDILTSKCNLIPSEDPSLNLIEETKKMPLNIDFAITNNEENHSIYIFVKVEINVDEKLKPGYSIMAEGVGVFSFESSVSEEEKKGLTSSGVNICITNLRSYVNTITSFYPLGRFSFHSIDMLALFKDKVETVKE